MIHTVLLTRRRGQLCIFTILAVLTSQCTNGHSNKMAAIHKQALQMLDSVITFKDLREGDKLAISFKFRNNSSRPLNIKDIYTDCGCTVAEKPEYAVPVNGIDSIKVRFNSTNKVGEVNKEITIKTDDADHKLTIVYLKGNVISRD